MGLREELLEQGVAYDKALERFMGKEDLYQKFLKKFLDDENFTNLKKYLGEKNVHEAFKCAHTIKGLCGNLGFDNILEIDEPLVEILRSDSLDGSSELFEKLENRYVVLCETIRKHV